MNDMLAIGFIGTGAMGEPMAVNLAKSGRRLVVWNRSVAKTAAPAAVGAEIAATAAAVLTACPTVFMMLVDGQAIDAVLARDTPEFLDRVRGRLIINTATVPPSYSKELETAIRAAGGRYLEAPVSGSRAPAEAGQLVAMLAGEPGVIEEARPLFSPLCRAVVPCGAVPRALHMKLSVNIFLLASVTGLAEAAHFATLQDLDMSQWAAVVDASQMASDISRLKVGKLLTGDLSPQAAIANVVETTRLVVESARESGASAPLMDVCLALYRRADTIGFGDLDTISVIRAFDNQATIKA